MVNSIHTFKPDTKLPHNKLEKLGFSWIENLQVYRARYSDSYYSSVIEVKAVGDSASIFLTDIHSKWSRSMARKAITALSSQNEYPDSFDICLNTTCRNYNTGGDEPRCWGTKNAEVCTCNGSRKRCNFYKYDENGNYV